MVETGELIGRIFDNRYKITELIGRGGMGAVYKAIHLAMNQIVALKVLGRSFTMDEKQVQRFYLEARASSRLKHPNTIKVFDFGRSEEGHLYIAMEYLEGETLGQLLKKEKVLAIRRACNIMKQALKSLGEAHQMGLIHRDLKLDNIFITKIFGEEDYVKVLDFGIAKFLEGTPDHESLTQAGLVCGTPTYISPEQALGRNLDPRSDLYSVGIILYEIIVGKPPFKAETPITLVLKHIHESPPPLNHFNPNIVVPEKLEKLIFKLLEKDRNKRPSSTKDVIDVIDEVIKEGGFPEIPSKDVKETVQYPPFKEISETRIDRGEIVVSPEDIDHEEPTRFLKQGEKEGLPLPDSEAPTTFLQSQEPSYVEPPQLLPLVEPVQQSTLTPEKMEKIPRPSTHAIYLKKRRKIYLWFSIPFVIILLSLSGYSIFVLSGGLKQEQALKYVPAVDLKINLPQPPKDLKTPQSPLKNVDRENKIKSEAMQVSALKENKVTITIRSTPDGADVFENDKKAGRTPYKTDVREKDENRIITLKKEGFGEMHWEINPKEIFKNESQEYSFVLEKLHPPPPKVEEKAMKKEIEKKVIKSVEKPKPKPLPPKKKKTIEWEDF